MRVYTDGACSGNPGPGGWAWAIDASTTPPDALPDPAYASGGEEQTTNQRMELQAVLEAIKAIPGPITIVSDSTYVVNCFRDRWYEGWIKRGWRNSAKKPVANRDIWEPLVEIYLERKDELDFEWVKGHSGDRMNDVVDQLAVDACQAIKDATANGSPPALSNGSLPAPALSNGSPPALSNGSPPAPWPRGRAVWIVGTTEPDADQQAALERTIAGLDPKADIAISGLRRGVELQAAERALSSGVPIGVALPFDDPAHKWAPADRDRFNDCIDNAEWVVVLDGDPAQPARAVDRRNEWLRSSVAGAIVVGDPPMVASLEAGGLSVIEID